MKTTTVIRLSFFCAFIFFASCKSKEITEDVPVYQSSLVDVSTLSDNLVSVKKSNAEKKFVSFLSDFFVKTAQSGNIASLEELIHPRYGIFIVDKPASFAIINRFESFEEIINNFPYFQNHLQGLTCNLPIADELPKFDCKTFDKQGCFYLKLEGSSTISNKIRRIESSISETCTKEEKQFAKDLDANIKHVVVMTESFIQLAFAEFDGKLYLVMIDTANYDCAS